MRNYRISIALFIAVLLMATTVGASSLPKEDANGNDGQVSLGDPTAIPTTKLSEYTKLVLSYIASREGIPNNRLLSINEHRREYPDLKKSYWYVKVIDLQTHQIYDAMLDLESLNIVAPEDVEEENAKGYYQNYGKLEPQLHSALQLKNTNDFVSVAVWFKSDDMQNRILKQLREDYPEIPQQAVDQPWLVLRDSKLRQSIQEDYLQLLKKYNLSLEEELA